MHVYRERYKNKIKKHVNKNLWTALKFEGIQSVVIKTETFIFLVKEINIYFFEMFWLSIDVFQGNSLRPGQQGFQTLLWENKMVL